MGKISKAKGCVGGLILGSAVRALIFIISAIIKALASVMVFLGLWVPFFYALLGGALYLLFQFDPFSGDLDSKIFIVGFGGSVLCALLITTKNLFGKPAQSIAEGFKKPIWQKQTEDTPPQDYTSPRRRYQNETNAPQQLPKHRRRYQEEYEEAPRLQASRRHSYTDEAEPVQQYGGRQPQPQIASYSGTKQIEESPKIYYSSLEGNTLIHEYSDRFEVFRIIDGRLLRDKVEYKNL